MKVFVYGTLKRGCRNSYLLASSRFVGAGQTVGRHRMIEVGFPVMAWRGHKLDSRCAPVLGEVYECDAAAVARLDELEAEGRMYRRRVKLVRLDSGRVVKAQAYVGIATAWRHRGRPVPLRGGSYDWGLHPAAGSI